MTIQLADADNFVELKGSASTHEQSKKVSFDFAGTIDPPTDSLVFWWAACRDSDSSGVPSLSATIDTPTLTPTEIQVMSPMEYHTVLSAYYNPTGSDSVDKSTNWGVESTQNAHSWHVMALNFESTNGKLELIASSQDGAGSSNVSSIATGSTGQLDPVEGDEWLVVVCGTSRTASDGLSVDGSGWTEPGNSGWIDSGSLNASMWYKVVNADTALNVTVSNSTGSSRMGASIQVFGVPASGGSTVSGDASVDGAGSVSAAGHVVTPGSGSVDGAGGVTAAGHVVTSGSGSVDGVGDVSAEGLIVVAGDASVDGTGSVSAAGHTVRNADGTVSGAGDVNPVGKVLGNVTGDASIDGAGTISAAGHVVVSGSATVTGAGGVSAEGKASFVQGSASVAGAGSLSAAGHVTVSGSVTVAGVGGISAAGNAAVHVQASGSIGGASSFFVGALVADGRDTPLFARTEQAPQGARPLEGTWLSRMK